MSGSGTYPKAPPSSEPYGIAGTWKAPPSSCTRALADRWPAKGTARVWIAPRRVTASATWTPSNTSKANHAWLRSRQEPAPSRIQVQACEASQHIRRLFQTSWSCGRGTCAGTKTKHHIGDCLGLGSKIYTCNSSTDLRWKLSWCHAIRVGDSTSVTLWRGRALVCKRDKATCSATAKQDMCIVF